MSLTTVLGLAVVVGVGSFLLDGIADGLVAERQQVALADAARGAGTAQQQFDAATTTTSAEVEQLAGDVVSSLEGAGPDRVRGVILLRDTGSPLGAGDGRVLVRDVASDGLDAGDVPSSLRAGVTSSDAQQLQIVDLSDGAGAPSLVVGSTVTLPRAGRYELYFVYSLASEEQTVSLVRTTFVGGGVALVLLVGAVAWVVTRMVVEPVR
ncbi:MAG: hypothetical protein ACRYF3_05680, partial [Janthinobacterium lividum]